MNEAGHHEVVVEGPPKAELGLYGPGDEVTLVAEGVEDKGGHGSRIEKDLNAGSYLVRIRYFETHKDQKFRVGVHRRPGGGPDAGRKGGG